MLNLLQKKLSESLINLFGLGSVGIIDVGSAGNLPPYWTRHCWNIRKLLRFEPREVETTNKNIVSLDTVLWSKKCKRDFYIYKGMSGSSLYKQNLNYVKKNYDVLKKRGKKSLSESWFERSTIEATEKVSCTTLDDILYKDLKSDDYDFLKIDAQGAEYEILKGAKKYLENKCIGVYAELFTIPLYFGIKPLSEVVRQLADHDFELVKKYPAHGSFASQHDCLFMKRNAQGRKARIIEKVYRV